MKRKISYDKLIELAQKDFPCFINIFKNYINNIIKEDPVTDKYTFFWSRSIPSISINDYIDRIIKNCKCSNICYLYVLYYLYRLNNENITSISKSTIHRIIISLVNIAIKFNEDEPETNYFNSVIYGISTIELMNLEYNMFEILNFNLIINESFCLYI